MGSEAAMQAPLCAPRSASAGRRKGGLKMGEARRDEDDEEQRQLDWEEYYVDRRLERDPKSGVDLIEELSKRKAAQGIRPPSRIRETRETQDSRGSEPAGKDESCKGPKSATGVGPDGQSYFSPEEIARLGEKAAVDPDEEAGRSKMREMLAARRGRHSSS